ncbi:hypothetical protein FKP32DRAFT_1580281 [Trametes sanguinea]|nr:hypothetical protein FKP32DRAFT_1580281 [Trametes sanguinea]
MNTKLSALTTVLFVFAAVPVATAGPIAYGICQTGCNVVAVACYAGAGAVMGTVTAGVGTPVAVLACNVALGQCSAACATVALFAPTP